MSVDKDTVKHIFHLARIGVQDDQLQPMTEEMNNILGWVEQLDEVDTDDVEPLTCAVDMKLHWRKDKVTDGGDAEKILKNAPASEYGYFAVPKVIE